MDEFDNSDSENGVTAGGSCHSSRTSLESPHESETSALGQLDSGRLQRNRGMDTDGGLQDNNDRADSLSMSETNHKRKKKQQRREQQTEVGSLRLRKLRNKCLTRWHSFDSGDDETNGNVEPEVEEIERLRREARDDINEVWNAAADLERELLSLHEETEQLRTMQDEFDEEKAAQAAQIRELLEKLEQVEAFWKDRLRGAEQELTETERRLHRHAVVETNITPVCPVATPTHSNELEERTTEMYHELVKAKEELSWMQKEKAEIKGEISELKAQLKKQNNIKEDFAVLKKKYDTLKTRAATQQQRLAQTDNNNEALTESLLESEAKAQELESLLDEQRERESELARHIEALRKVNTPMHTDEIHEPSPHFDLFAELQQAQDVTKILPDQFTEMKLQLEEPNKILAMDHAVLDVVIPTEQPLKELVTKNAVVDIEILKELALLLPISHEVNIPSDMADKAVLAKHMQASISILGKTFSDFMCDAASVSILKEYPKLKLVRESEMMIENEQDEAPQPVIVHVPQKVPVDGKGIHIHLHSHYHTHMHQHTHQHDHIHHCGWSAKRQSHDTPRVPPRAAVGASHKLIREKKIPHAEIIFSQKEVVGHPAADGEGPKASRQSVPTPNGSSRLRTVLVEGQPKVVTHSVPMPAATNDDDRGGDVKYTSKSQINSAAYATTKFSARHCRHGEIAPKEINPADYPEFTNVAKSHFNAATRFVDQNVAQG